MKPEQLLSKLKQLEQGKLQQIVGQVAKEKENQITSLNKDQLAKGEYPSGEKTPLYSPFTLEEKSKDGTLFGDGKHFSLRNRGNLYNSMKVSVDGDNLDITADSTSAKLFDEKFSGRRLKVDYFLGLNDKNSEKVSEEISKAASSRLNKFLNGL